MDKSAKKEAKKEVKKELKAQGVPKDVAKKAAKKVVKKRFSSLNEAALYHSDYLRTILDAVQVVGVKIPDEITTPSFTVQVLLKFVIAANTGAGGNTGCGFFRTLGNTGAGIGVGYATLAASAVAAQYSPTGQTSGFAGGLVAQATSCRLVSAKATMTYLASPNNASGRILMGFLPPYQPGQIQSIAGAFPSNVALSGVAAGQNLLQLPNLVDVPASKLYGEVRYLPTDDISRAYEVSGSLAIGTLRAPATNGAATYGSFVGIVDGCPSGSSVEVNIWENYEVIPLTSLVNLVQPTASLSDPVEMTVAANVVSSVPSIAVMQGKDSQAATAMAAPTTSKDVGNLATGVKANSHTVTESAGTPFMDKLVSGVGQMIDVGKQAAPLISSIAAML